MAVAKKKDVIEIRPIETTTFTVEIKGDTPLIMHAWSEKAKRQMLDTQTGNKKGKAKEARNPVADFIESMHWLEGRPNIDGLSPEECEVAFAEAIGNGARFGFPVTAFKQAAISAAYRLGWSKDKASLRGVFFIESDENGMIEIQSETPIMREDTVRIGQGSADLRYRGEFRNWSAKLNVQYNKNGNYDKAAIVNILNAGGYVCGAGEWRPERDGQYGMYHVVANKK